MASVDDAAPAAITSRCSQRRLDSVLPAQEPSTCFLMTPLELWRGIRGGGLDSLNFDHYPHAMKVRIVT